MFKDYDRCLKITFKMYLFVLVIIIIMKLVGLDYFGIDINNHFFNNFNQWILNNKLENIYYCFTLLFYQYMFISLSTNINSKKIKIYSLATTVFAILIKYLDTFIANSLIIAIIDFAYLFIVCLIPNKKYKLIEFAKRFTCVYLLNTLFQLISLYLRNIQYNNINLMFIIRAILDLDYILMLLIYYKINFKEGGVKICGVEVSLFLLMKANLRKLLKTLQTNLHNFKLQTKKQKMSLIIYIILSVIWNSLSVIIILFIAKLNDSLIECVFILTSFFISKHLFDHIFHFKSMMQCFIVSNLTYYMLNKITTPIGISILIPVLLGVSLAYITSKFVKKKYYKLYKGISPLLFDQTILNVVDKDSIKYKICYQYYVENNLAITLALKYHYSEPGIRKIIDNVNKKIRALN